MSINGFDLSNMVDVILFYTNHFLLALVLYFLLKLISYPAKSSGAGISSEEDVQLV